MKTLLTAAAALLATVAISSTAQAYDGPSFSHCKIETSGASESFLVLNGSATRGTIQCTKTNGQKVYQNVVLPMTGVELGVRRSTNLFASLGSLIIRSCPMDVEIDLVGAELNINLTPTVINRLMRMIVVAEIVNPLNIGETGVATLAFNNRDLGVAVGVGKIEYGNDCTVAAGLKFGALVDQGTYDRRQEERAARQANRD